MALIKTVAAAEITAIGCSMTIRANCSLLAFLYEINEFCRLVIKILARHVVRKLPSVVTVS